MIGGYLGAGKTTLLNRLLRSNEGSRLAVIVNDFGDIGIDADLVVDRDGDTINLANGCICCSLSDGLAVVLDGLRERADDIDHVIVEASGVSDPARIGDYSAPFGFQLRGVIVLADAEQIRSRATDKYVGTTVLRQLRGADLLVLTKVDLVGGEQLDDVRAWLSGIAPGTPIVEAADGRLATSIVLGDLEPSAHDARSDPEHALDYDVWSASSPTPLDRADVITFVGLLPPGVLRGKGIVHLADDPLHRYVLQVVGRRSELTSDRRWSDDEERTTRLVVLARPGTLTTGASFTEFARHMLR